MSMENVFRIPGYKRILDGAAKIWERAVPVTTAKSNPVSFTNTRKTPFDALPHLKAFGATPVKHKQDKLWSRFVPCDGITNASSTSIDTGVKAQDNIEMFVRFKAVTDSFYILQARETGSAKIYGLSGSQTGNTITSFGLTSAIKRTTGHICTAKMTMVNRAVTLYVKDETTGEEDTKTGTASASDYAFPSPTTIKLFGDASKIGSGVTVYRAYIKINGEMKWDMYPAVDVDNSNAPVAYDDVAHKASTVVSGSITGGSLIQPIVYAESDGTAWADTEIIPTTFDYTITYEGAIKKLDGGPNCAWGYMGGSGNLPRWVCGTYNNKYLLNANTTSQIDVTADTDNHAFIGKVYENNGTPYWSSKLDGVDKQSVALSSVDTWAGNTLSIYLFARHNVDGAGNFAPGTLKRWICEKAGVVIKHYIPVRIGTTVELLDLVNWTFATRTGTFTAGADIPYTQLCPDIIKVNTGDLAYGQYGKNLFERPDGSYSSSDRGSVSVSNQVITVNYQWSSAWSTYKLSGAVNSNSIAASTTQMKSNAGTDVLFKAGKTYIVKLFDSTTDYYDLQVSNVATNMQIRDGVAFTPTEDFNALWVRTQESTQAAGNHTFKVMIVEGSTAPTEYEPYHFGIHTDGEHTLTISADGEMDISRDIPMLLSADSFVDTQVDSNNKSEAWAVTVLDGTNVGVTSKQGNVWVAAVSGKVSAKTEIVCSHFPYSTGTSSTAPDHTCISFASYQFGFRADEFSTAAEVNAWLAAQYAKGTPVIFLYPLATPAVSTHAIAKVELTEKATYTVNGTAELPVTEQATYLGVGV